MKNKFFAVAAFLAFSTVATAASSLMEVASSISAAAEVQAIKINKDGSVTFKDISVQRGDQVYRVSVEDASTENYTTVCRMLGFDTNTVAPGLNEFGNVNGVKAVLNADGSFKNTRTYNYFVTKVTCHKNGSLKTVLEFDKVANADGSSKITNLQFLRGDQTYMVSVENAAEADYHSVCKLVGFEESLTGDGLNSFANIAGNKVVVNARGEFSHFRNYNYTVTKLTCFSGSEPSLIVLIGGTRYTRIIP